MMVVTAPEMWRGAGTLASRAAFTAMRPSSRGVASSSGNRRSISAASARSAEAERVSRMRRR